MKDLNHAAWAVRDQIAAIPVEATYEEYSQQILAIFAKAKHACDIFWMLDERPGHFGMGPWHARLRSVRNNPNEGKQLFKGFK
ncbi:MAG TPA: hypothetical protein PLN42_06695 [Anaerolineae bacterium]|nr:hypothetical protein [Anaerolineae bacterium]